MEAPRPGPALGSGRPRPVQRTRHRMARSNQGLAVMKINWFSPLPPARSEIARYAAPVIEALSQQVQVIAWTDQNEWDSRLEDFCDVVRYQADSIPWSRLNDSDVTVYHIGNNAL